jgi:hypothetical protein
MNYPLTPRYAVEKKRCKLNMQQTNVLVNMSTIYLNVWFLFHDCFKIDKVIYCRMALDDREI